MALNYSLMAAWQACNRPGVSRSFDATTAVPLEAEYPELAAKGMKNIGSENYGGPVVTAAGLVFIAGTVYDRNVRAFDSKTGHLQGGQPPVCRQCNSYTYMIDGNQYVPIAASGARDPKGPQGTACVALALP